MAATSSRPQGVDSDLAARTGIEGMLLVQEPHCPSQRDTEQARGPGPRQISITATAQEVVGSPLDGFLNPRLMAHSLCFDPVGSEGAGLAAAAAAVSPTQKTISLFDPCCTNLRSLAYVSHPAGKGLQIPDLSQNS